MPLAFTFHPGIILSVLSFGALFGWIFWRWKQTSTDTTPVLTTKILISVAFGGGGIWCGANLGPFVGVPLAAICGIVVGLCWGKNIGLAIANPLASLYDGGSEEPEAVPFYAIAEAHRKQARYAEAIGEIENQLELFPGDVRGLLMLAEIRCRNLGDWEGARVAVEGIVSNEVLAVATRAKALQALADWHVDLAHDAAGARELLARIQELFPGTPEAVDAAQRLAHTGDGSWRREQKAPSLLHVPKADDRLGLRMRDEVPEPPPEADPEVEAEELRQQLAMHPQDNEARERLALLYVNRFQRLDWATGEFDKLLAQPHQPAKMVARWLNQLADVQIRCGGHEAAARATLLRVAQLFPGTAHAAKAKSRMDFLKLEMRVNEKGQVMRPGLASEEGRGPSD